MADQVRVFVSHHHSPEEDAFTGRLVADLEAAGADAWVDDQRITSDDFIKKINEGLAGRQWLVLVMTPDALCSPWVQAEVNAALHQVRKGRMLGVVPIIAKPCDDADIPPLLDTLHRYDAARAYEPARDGLLRALGLSGPPLPPQPIIRESDSIRPAPEYGTGGSTEHNGAIEREAQAETATGILERLRQARIQRIVPSRLGSLGFRGVSFNDTPAIVPSLIHIPAGSFLMGSEWVTDSQARDNEQPQHRVEVSDFLVAKYPVTVAEYALAVRAGAVCEPPASGHVNWTHQLRHPDHPVVCVSWNDARTYIEWLATITQHSRWRLPTEAEWEKAARWDLRRGASRTYPWGNTFDSNRCNTFENGLGNTTPVGSFPAGSPRRSGASPFGVEDMSGNIWEWTSSLLKPFPYVYVDGREVQESVGERTLRGGSWYSSARDARAACRGSALPNSTYYSSLRGFRLACTPASIDF